MRYGLPYRGSKNKSPEGCVEVASTGKRSSERMKVGETGAML